MALGTDVLELDLRGLKCPLPVLRTRKALTTLGAGTIVRVMATDPMSAIDIPHMCREDGHTLVSVEQLDGRTLAFTIRAGGRSGKATGEA
jgi:tRNA 2-thiouridine synthesizing protein A